jgi:hypothetical protein
LNLALPPPAVSFDSVSSSPIRGEISSYTVPFQH